MKFDKNVYAEKISENLFSNVVFETRHADRYTRYKDGLNFVNGKIVGSYGGGLCQLMYGEILSQCPVKTEYTVFNSSVSYIKRNEKIYQVSVVCREETDQETGEHTQRELYTNQCEISYSLPDNIEVKSLD